MRVLAAASRDGPNVTSPTAAESPAALNLSSNQLHRELHHHHPQRPKLFKMAKSVMEPFTFASSRSLKMTLNVRM